MPQLPPELRREMARAAARLGSVSTTAPRTPVQDERRLAMKIALMIGAICCIAMLMTS